MQDFHSLKVWEKSHEFTLRIYSITRLMPKDEIYGLISQIRRSASSIPINIAEGCGRGSDADFSRFLHMSMGSASESEYLLFLCKELNYIDSDLYQDLITDITLIKKMLNSLLTKTKSKK